MNSSACPSGKKTAARRSRSLRRDFPREGPAVRADGKLGSSVKDRFWGVTRGRIILNLRGSFPKLRVIFLFHLAGKARILQGRVGPKAGETTGTYSKRPSSTTSEIRTPCLDDVSLRGGDTMIPSLTGMLCSTPVQISPVPKSTLIIQYLACTHCLHMAPCSIYGA